MDAIKKGDAISFHHSHQKKMNKCPVLTRKDGRTCKRTANAHHHLHRIL